MRPEQRRQALLVLVAVTLAVVVYVEWPRAAGRSRGRRHQPRREQRDRPVPPASGRRTRCASGGARGSTRTGPDVERNLFKFQPKPAPPPPVPQAVVTPRLRRAERSAGAAAATADRD